MQNRMAMSPSAPIAITNVLFAVYFCIAFSSCASAGGAANPPSGHSDVTADAGAASDAAEALEGDASLDSGSALDAGVQAVAAPEDLSIPIGACLPRKTGGVPVVKVGPTRVGFPMELVEIFVRRGARAAIDECVVVAREREPKLQGKVVLHFELPTTGGIKGAAVSRGVGDGVLHECITTALEKSPMPVLREGGRTIIDNYGVVICPDGHTEWPHEGGFR